MIWEQIAALWLVPVVLLPVLLHLWRLRRRRTLHWGSLLILQRMLQRHQGRLLLNRWGLMLVRMLVLTLLVLAWSRPRWPASDHSHRDGPVAAVVLVDDSASASRGQERNAWQGMLQQLDTYLASLRPGDEVSLIRASRLDAAVRPRFDHSNLRQEVANWQAATSASNIPRLLTAGLEQLSYHVNQDVEVVLVTDSADDGWQPDHTDHWRLLRERRQALIKRQELRVYQLQAAPQPAATENLAISQAWLSQELVPRGTELRLDLQWQRWGQGDASYRIRFLVDGSAVAEQALNDHRAQGELSFSTRLYSAGSHLLSVELIGPSDACRLDDSRHLACTVLPSLPVLILEGHAGAGAYLAAALEASTNDGSPFQVQRMHYGSWQAAEPDPHSVLALVDIPALPPDQIAAIERFLLGGGGVLVSGGPYLQCAHARRSWWRSGDGFLPAAPLPSQTGSGTVEVVSWDHPALQALPRGGLFDASRLGRVHPTEASADSRRLLQTSDGLALCLERQRGAGRAVFWTTSLDRSWGDWPLHASFPLLMRQLMVHLAGTQVPRRNYLVGERLLVLPRGPTDAVRTLDGDLGPLHPDPGGPGLRSTPMRQPGTRTVSDGESVLHYSVNLSPQECQPDDRGLVAAVAWRQDWQVRHFTSNHAVADALMPKRVGQTEPRFWLLILVLILLLADWWWASLIHQREGPR